MPCFNPPSAPISLIVFPQRDFISASGYNAADRVIVRVIHDGAVFPPGNIWTTDPANWVVPQVDPTLPPGQDGVVEVNHPGGACWFGTTPDIRPGDRVQIQVMAGPNAGRIDETTVANITAKRPVQTAPDTIVVHGVAQDSFTAIPGNPLAIATLEHRIVAPGSHFEANGRRTLRAVSVAGSDGTLAYDPIDPVANPNGIKWTATYSGLSPADVELALSAESRGMWLGAAVAPALETTVFEIGALTFAGPSAPCTAPLELLPPPPGSELIPPTDPTNLSATINNSNTVTLNWTASTDNVGVTAYGIYRDGINIFTVSNPDGSAPAQTTFVDRNTPPGTYTFQVRAFDEAGNASGFSNTAGPVTAVQQLDVNNFPVNEPPSLPINIIVFPSRDFVSPSGYNNDDTVTVQLLRRNSAGNYVVISSADGIVPIDGFAEVNHPGGACWEGVTPEIRVGDRVRTIAYNPANIGPGNPDGIRSVDQTTVAGVTAFRPVVVQNDNIATPIAFEGIVEIHGTALGTNGLPLPIDQIEQRMIATHGQGLWDFNGRRAMRAGANSDGTLTYDTVNNPMGIKWTARYTNLSADDVARMAGGISLSTGTLFPGADTRIHWLGTQPLLLAEATIFENADGNPPGPAGPGCTRPLEAADVVAPTTPAGFTVTQTGSSQVRLSWSPPSTDDWYVAGYRIYQNGVAIANAGATATQFVVDGVAPGGHTYAVRAFDAASALGGDANDPIISRIIAGFGNVYGNLSVPTQTITLVQADVTPPTVPQALTAVAGLGEVILNWSPSADDVGVNHYDIYRFDGSDYQLIGTSPDTNFTNSDCDLGTFTYTVDAVDAAGNHSAQSASASATVTAVPDVTAPDWPNNDANGVLTATTSPDIHGRNIALTWVAATDDVGVAGYNIYRNNVKITSVNGTTLTYLDANLPTGTYTYTVEAFDSPGNRSILSAPDTAVVANDPPAAPHSLIAFPARDFISATGYTPGAFYVFTLIRGAQVYTSAPFPADATGLIEVNHPNGTCWNINTPNMRAGDVVRITEVATGIADQTTVANITAERPIATNANTIIVRGTAVQANGTQFPIDQLDQRLIANRDAFEKNGRRVLRTGGGDGTIAYDVPGSTTNFRWTATYTGLSSTDMVRAVGGTTTDGRVFAGSESRILWLGRAPLALVETTIFENGPGVVGGPSAPCTAPGETPVAAASSAPASLDFLTQSAVPATTSLAKTLTFSNGGGAVMTLTNIYIAGLNPGDFARSGGSCPNSFPANLGIGNSCTVDITFSPKALGLRQANVSFSNNAANTTDQTVPLTGSGIDLAAPNAPGTPGHSLAAGTGLTVVATLANSTIPVNISWTASTGHPVTSYELQRSVNNGAFVNVPLADATPNVTLNLAMGTTTTPNTYRFQVRGCNSTNCSAWAVGPVFSAMPIDESDKNYVSYGGTFTPQNVAGSYGGSVRSATTNKDKAQLPNKVTFTTVGSMALVTVVGPDRGRATVSIDGGAPINIDLYAPVQRVATIGYAANGLASGRQHSMVVQVLGTRNPASTSTRVDIDAFVLLK